MDGVAKLPATVTVDRFGFDFTHTGADAEALTPGYRPTTPEVSPLTLFAPSSVTVTVYRFGFDFTHTGTDLRTLLRCQFEAQYMRRLVTAGTKPGWYYLWAYVPGRLNFKQVAPIDTPSHRSSVCVG